MELTERGVGIVTPTHKFCDGNGCDTMVGKGLIVTIAIAEFIEEQPLDGNDITQ